MLAAAVLGLVTGMSYSLLAAGLVLVFRANRFLNLAQAQLGTVSALLLARLVVDGGWSWWLAFPLALAAAAGVGALVDVVVVRRLERRGAVPLLLASLGVSQLLLGLTLLDALRPNQARIVLDGYPMPFRADVTVGALVLRTEHLLALVLVPAAVGGLALLLTRTTFGTAIRAAAGNRDAALLAGVPVRRTSTAVWAIAGALAGVAAILQAPGQAPFNLSALGTAVLLRGLAAAMLGGFTSFGWALGGGIGIGVVEGVALHLTNDAGVAEALLFAAVLAVVLLRTQGRPPLPLPPSPTPAAVLPARLPGAPLALRRPRRALALLGLGVGVATPFVLDRPSQHFALSLVLVFALVGVALTVLVGWAGQVSLGHVAFLGIGAYTAARLVPAGWSLPLVMLAAAAAGALVAAAVGLPALRRGSLALTVTTLGLAVVGPNWLFVQPWIGQAGNLPVAAPGLAGVGRLSSQFEVYLAALVTLCLLLAAAGRLRSSTAGRRLVAARDNERAAAAAGVDVVQLRLAVLALSGATAAVAGVLWAAAWRNVSPQLLGPEQSLLALAVPVIGGLGSLPGAVLGALWVVGVPFAVSGSTAFALAFSGGGLLLVQLVAPDGLAGLVRRLVLRGVPAARREVVREPT